MVDATDLTLFATLVQTAVITLTLLVFIFQFRGQEKAIKESSYQNLLGRYNEYILSGDSADNQLLTRLFPPAQKMSADDLAAMRRLMIVYGILEEAYELYEKGWINKETWEQWDTWLKAMCAHPYFVTLHSRTTGMFNPRFQEHVTRIIEANPPRDQGGANPSSRPDRPTDT